MPSKLWCAYCTHIHNYIKISKQFQSQEKSFLFYVSFLVIYLWKFASRQSIQSNKNKIRSNECALSPRIKSQYKIDYIEQLLEWNEKVKKNRLRKKWFNGKVNSIELVFVDFQAKQHKIHCKIRTQFNKKKEEICCVFIPNKNAHSVQIMRFISWTYIITARTNEFRWYQIEIFNDIYENPSVGCESDDRVAKYLHTYRINGVRSICDFEIFKSTSIWSHFNLLIPNAMLSCNKTSRRMPIKAQ